MTHRKAVAADEVEEWEGSVGGGQKSSETSVKCHFWEETFASRLNPGQMMRHGIREGVGSKRAKAVRRKF